MASRIFVTNLPPNLKEEDFKKHFSDLAPVTDARLIPKRRIGYVGYKTPELALKAIKYYNRSFIRMSKINVELARSVDEVRPRKKARVEREEPISIPSMAQAAEKAQNPKLQEFLIAMAPSSKSKTWANEEPTSGQQLPEVDHTNQDISDESEAEYQTISKERNPHKHQEAMDEIKDKLELQNPLKSSHEGLVDSRTEDFSQDEDAEGADGKVASSNPEVFSNNAHPSDTDWLRSKTSRLLELVEDEELEDRGENMEHQPLDEAETPASHVTGSGEKVLAVNAESQIDDVQQEEVTAKSEFSLEHTETGRLFLRNLSYGTYETELEKLFASHGLVEEVHISRDTRSGVSKGFGYVQFSKPEEAVAAGKALDGQSFEGRLLHIIPAKAKKAQGLDEFEISKLPLKKQRDIRRKAEASTATFKWNSLYMNPDAILSSVATRLGVSKTDVLDPTSSDAAVKQAHAEVNVIKEVKNYFAKHGVNLDSFKGKEYSEQAILIKNFPYGTSAEELKRMFEAYGTVNRFLMPPSATIAIVEMETPTQAKSAFSSLAYRKFKDSVLFLEKAPKSLFISENPDVSTEAEAEKASTSVLLAEEEAAMLSLTKSTLFVRNLNFSTTSVELRDLFMPLNGFLSATVKTKADPKRPRQHLSMGFGFVEFRSKENAMSAMAAMNGHKLAGHDLIIKESNKAIDAADERRKEDAAKKLAAQRTKIIIRNLPFQATKKDVRALFGPYGQLRTVRVPKKFDGTSRGFAFAEFITTREAQNAIKSLTGIHLLGRRLNLEYAAGDTLDAEEEIEKMSKKVSKQAEKVAIQNLTGSGRKKFSVRQGEDAEID